MLNQGLQRGVTRFVLALAVAVGAIGVPQAPVQAQTQTQTQHASGAALLAHHGELRAKLADNAFQRPLHLASIQNAGNQQGDVYAVVEHPFADVSQSLQVTHNWCDLLILHLNVKHCKATGVSPASVLSVSVGKKFDQPLPETYQVNFNYRVAAARPDFMQVTLAAENGPLGTHNYRIMFEAVPLDAGRSFIHMSYSYSYGMAARMAMQAYLSTIGSGKVGFTVTGRAPSGQPQYVDGVRGVVERNTMRYYLAIEAFLDSAGKPASEQMERRLRDWFAATERYPLQLRELEQGEYIDMKRKEVQRQQVAARQ